MGRTPVYFISHGTPYIIEDKAHPAYRTLQSIGKDILSHKPKAIVLVSAHWEGSPNEIEVNVAEKTPLIYDFYGFPDHFYEWTFNHAGSNDLASKIRGCLDAAGIPNAGSVRGLDHGGWAPLSVAFPTGLGDIPIVQMSLYSSDDGGKHYDLGKAIAPLRDEGIMIICSGQAVHNLPDYRLRRSADYGPTFDEAVRDAAESDAADRREQFIGLLNRKDSRKAHPSFEHLLPLFVAAGAAGEDAGKRTWTMFEYGLSYAQFIFQ